MSPEIVKKHSRFGASSAERWVTCPASIGLSEGLPPAPTSKYAEEGTKAHTVAETVLVELLNTGAIDKSNYIFDDPDMVLGGEIYADYVLNSLPSKPDLFFIEKKLDLSSVLHLECFGTVDSAAVVDNHIHVYDYKYGAGMAVEVDNNLQLSYYALGVYCGLTKAEQKLIKGYTLHIIQPRATHDKGPCRSATYKISELNLLKDILKKAIDSALGPNPVFKANKKTCKWCPAAAVCPEITQNQLKQAAIDFSAPVMPSPLSLSAETVAAILEKAEHIETWLDAVKRYAQDLLERGHKVEGYKLVPRRATRKWVGPSELLEKEARKLFGEAAFVTEIKSPAQLEKIKINGAKEFIESHCQAVSSGFTMAKDDDKRQAVNQLETDFR